MECITTIVNGAGGEIKAQVMTYHRWKNVLLRGVDWKLAMSFGPIYPYKNTRKLKYT